MAQQTFRDLFMEAGTLSDQWAGEFLKYLRPCLGLVNFPILEVSPPPCACEAIGIASKKYKTLYKHSMYIKVCRVIYTNCVNVNGDFDTHVQHNLKSRNKLQQIGERMDYTYHSRFVEWTEILGMSCTYSLLNCYLTLLQLHTLSMQGARDICSRVESRVTSCGHQQFKRFDPEQFEQCR